MGERVHSNLKIMQNLQFFTQARLQRLRSFSCLTETRNSVTQVVLTNLKANSIHYLGQAPSTTNTDITANELATTVGDKVHDTISALINEVGDLWYNTSK